MLAPLRLFVMSVVQFGRGLGPAILMGAACLVAQVVLVLSTTAVWSAVTTPPPLSARLDGRRDPQEWVSDLSAEVAIPAMLSYFEVLVVLLLTAWLLRAAGPFRLGAVLKRAAGAALGLTVIAGATYLALFVARSFLVPPSPDPVAWGWWVSLALWFAASALLLPARVMGFRPTIARGPWASSAVAAAALVPWFAASEVLGRLLRTCGGCWGLFEGGVVALPLLAVYMCGLTVVSAAVSAAACMGSRPTPAARPSSS